MARKRKGEFDFDQQSASKENEYLLEEGAKGKTEGKV